MAVIRINKTDNYTVMSNHHLRNTNLSLKAIGLLSKMLSLRDDWEYSISGLVAICKENETAVKNALNELKDEGYVTIIKFMPNETKSGRIEYEYNVYEQPQTLQAEEKQEVENLPLENQSVENRGQLNTEQSNTDKLNIDYKSIIGYLNKKTGRHYRYDTPETKRLIDARVKQNKATIFDFYEVIDKKCSDWLHDGKMKKYLRPQTLFGTKFDAYLNEEIVIPDEVGYLLPEEILKKSG